MITQEQHSRLRVRFAELVLERVTDPKKGRCYEHPDIIVQRIEGGGVAAEDFAGLFAKAFQDVGLNHIDFSSEEWEAIAEQYVHLPSPFRGV